MPVARWFASHRATILPESGVSKQPALGRSGVHLSPRWWRRGLRRAVDWAEFAYELICVPIAIWNVARTKWLMRRIPFAKAGTAPHRILFPALEHLGDCAWTVPLLLELRHRWPEASITVVTHPASAALYEAVSDCEILVLPCRPGRWRRLLGQPRRHYAFAREILWPRDFDLCLIPRHDADYQGATLLSYLSRAPVRISFSEHVTPSKARQNFGYDRLLTAALPYRGQLEAECLMDLLTPLHARPQPGTLPRPHADPGWAAGELSSHRHWVAMCPSAGTLPIKQWGLPRWAEVARYLSAAGFAVALVGAKSDRAAADWVAAHFQGTCRNLAGETSLPQLLSVLASCELVIGHDCGPTHLASMLNRPTLDVRGPTCAHRFGVWSDRGRSLGVILDCSPCRRHPRHRCRVCIYDRPRCFAELQPSEVAQTALDLLRGSTAAGGAAS